MRFTDGAKWWLFSGKPSVVLGTSLCFRREYWTRNPFPSKQIAEDVDFVKAAADAQELDVADEAGELMYATIHPGNTSRRNLRAREWQAL